ncbi:MAG: sulfatase family protein [Planctomycetota bacterium]|jgi:N-acetylglucosamine-6-sulfatase
MYLNPVAAAFSLILVSCSQTPVALDESPQPGFESRRPNVVMIVVDDLRWDELGVTGHPYLETPNIDALARKGAMFTNAFHAVPLCSPNRASILTGQYPSRHGIIDNVARSRASHHLNTFPRALQQNGYETAFIGKWHMGNDPTPRPGFDHWVAIPGQGRTMNPELYEHGRIHEVEGYITDVFTDRAVEIIENKKDDPFFIYIGHKAIHPDAVQLDDGSVDLSVKRGYMPAPRHRGRYESDVFPRRQSQIASLDDLADRPALQRALRNKYSPETIAAWGRDELDPGTKEETIRRRAEMMLAVDEGVGEILAALERQGILDETVILFTSDNGFFYGEHGLSLERRMPYEESIRSPLIVRYPAAVRPQTRLDQLVASVDLAPTVLEFTGTAVGDHIQGDSLLPLLRGEAADWRESLYIEFYTYENPFPWLLDMDYRALRTQRYKYIHWMQHPEESELYDLQLDPLEKHNRIADPELAPVLDHLKAEMAEGALAALGLGR